jgi:hypothetical protein
MRSILCLFIAIYLVAAAKSVFGQLDYVPPILCETGNAPKIEGVFLLNTVDFHTQLGAPSHYPSSLQIIDPMHPWPPLFFVNAQPGGKGLIGNGYFSTFQFQDASRQLSFYTGLTASGTAKGCFVVCDTNFQILDSVKGSSSNIDSHDFQINSQGERLYMTVFDTILNLAPFSKDYTDTAVLVTSQVIEIADQKGNVVFRWNPHNHFSVTESYRKFHDLTDNNPFTKGWDWQHVNSAGFTHEGNIVYSFRFIGVGKINRQRGEVMWKLGGKNPTISVPADGEFIKQHNFQEISPNEYSLFSNGDKKHSCKALVYRIDEKANTARVIRVYNPDSAIYSISLGNYQTGKSGLCIINYGKYFTLQERQIAFEVVDTSGKKYSTYSSPSLNFAYRVQYVDSWKPVRPVIINDSGTLTVSGNPNSVKWYLMEGTNLKHLSDNVTYKPSESGTYVATSRAGFGWYVTNPFDF